ncbi:MAG: NADH-quinone oxidoreductase subunit N, partial [Nocardioidaceae bacterium]|nr:NADH-quinone oxidoreductase subunit N [Nocardioidaceae bacterium]
MTGMAMGEEFLALLPELLLLSGAVVGLLLGLWTPQDRQGRVRAVVVVACLAAAGATGADLGDPARAVFDGTWVIDTTTTVVRLTVSLGTAVTVLLAASSVAGHPRETEAYVLMVLGGIGSIALAASGDLLMLVAGYLLASVPLYALAGFAKDASGVEATLKYYLMGAFVGVLMLVGVACLVLASGVTGYAALGVALPAAPRALVAVGVLGVVAGVAFKAGAVPVHFWVP